MGLPGTLAQQLYWLVTLATMGLCIALGDRALRLGACLVLANFAASALVEGLTWQGIRIAVVVVDGALLAALFWLSLEHRRWWTRLAAAYALLGFLAHFVALFDLTIWWRAYVGLRWILSAGVLVAVVLGLVELPFARRYERWAAARSTTQPN